VLNYSDNIFEGKKNTRILPQYSVRLNEQLIIVGDELLDEKKPILTGMDINCKILIGINKPSIK